MFEPPLPIDWRDPGDWPKWYKQQSKLKQWTIALTGVFAVAGGLAWSGGLFDDAPKELPEKSGNIPSLDDRRVAAMKMKNTIGPALARDAAQLCAPHIRAYLKEEGVDESEIPGRVKGETSKLYNQGAAVFRTMAEPPFGGAEPPTDIVDTVLDAEALRLKGYIFVARPFDQNPLNVDSTKAVAHAKNSIANPDTGTTIETPLVAIDYKTTNTFAEEAKGVLSILNDPKIDHQLGEGKYVVLYNHANRPGKDYVTYKVLSKENMFPTINDGVNEVELETSYQKNPCITKPKDRFSTNQDGQQKIALTTLGPQALTIN